MPDIETEIKVIEISSYLANNDIANGSLFGQRINPKLAVILFMIAKVLRKIWTLDPNYPNLQKVGDYGYYLSAPYNQKALAILNQGGTGIVAGTSTAESNSIWMRTIYSSNFSDATHYDNEDIAGRTIERIFDNNNQKMLNRKGEPLDWGYTDTGIVFYNIDATENSYDFTIWVKGAPPSNATVVTTEPLIININNESTKVINWTTELSALYGDFPSFEVWLDQGTGLRPVTAQPLIDAAPPNFTTMTFDFGTPVNGFIRIS